MRPPKARSSPSRPAGATSPRLLFPVPRPSSFRHSPLPAGIRQPSIILTLVTAQPPYYGFNDFASHTYDYPGTYLLKYRAGTACDRWTEGIHTLVVAEPPNYTPVLHGCTIVQPQAGFSGAPLSGIAPLTVQFTSTSTGANAYTWDFGDGTSSPAENPRHTYMTSGLYSVTLEARDICTNAVSTASMSHYVTITVQSGTLAITTDPGESQCLYR